jgi:truncated hemoglobin YjbI
MGDPLLPHVFLQGLTPEIFDQWLKLFSATLDEIYTPSMLEIFMEKQKHFLLGL